MAQVSYGTITITDTTDKNIFIRYSANSDGSSSTSSPTSTTKYVGIYCGTAQTEQEAMASSTGWSWSEYIGTDGLSVKSTRILYYLNTSNSDAPQVTSGTIIASIDVTNQWTSLNPTYVANATYWTCLEVTLSDNTTKSWSTPTKDLGLTQTAKDAAETKSIATNAAENSQGALSIAQNINQHFFKIATDYSASVPAGSYITEINVDTFKASPSGGNLLTRSDGVWLRNGADILASLQGTGLTFLIPTGTYKGRKSLEIVGGSTPAINLYDAQNNTVAATLTSTGLVLGKGGIKSGSVSAGNNGFVYLSTQDYGTALTIGNGSDKTDWRAIIGTKFGVDDEGNLYASNVNITGTLSAGANSIIGPWTVTSTSIYKGNATYGTSGDGNMYFGNSGLSISNKFKVDNAGNLTATGANIAGEIKADTGRIGGSSGWTIESQKIYKGSIGTDDSMYLSTENLAGTVADTTLLTTAPSWRLTVGSNFGVDNTGKLYATGANISGSIEVLSDSNIYTKDYIDNIQSIVESTNSMAEENDTNLSAIEQIINITEWANLYGTFTITADTTVDSNKQYWLINNGQYYMSNPISTYEYVLSTAEVADINKIYYERVYNSETSSYEYNPVNNPVSPRENGYYELILTSPNPHDLGYYECNLNNNKPLTDYINSYLKLTNNSLVISCDNPDQPAKIELNETGLNIYNKDGNIAASYGTDTIIGEEEGFHIKIGMDYGLTKDVVADENKTYYTLNSSNEYVVVTGTISGNPKDLGYYEKEMQIGFYQNKFTKVAYVSGNYLYIPNSIVLESMKISENWEWKIQPNNNLTLAWVGGNE